MTAALDRATAALGNANVRAFLRVIREGESNQNEDAYTIIFGGEHFAAPPWRHPFYGIPTTQGAKASGAYQFLGTTFARCNEALGLGEDFSPANQDIAAVHLVVGRGALADIEAANLVAACSKLRDEWVSLPGLGLARVQRVFQQYGGSFGPQNNAGEAIATAPTQPHTEGSMPLVPLLLTLLPSVLGLFAPKAQQKLQQVTGQPAEIVGPFLTDLFTKIGQATGVLPTGQPIATEAQAIQAAGAVQTATAEQLQAIQSHALDYLDKVAPMLDKISTYEQAAWNAEESSRDNAAARSLQQQEAGVWNNPAFIIALIVLALVSVVVVAVLFVGQFSTDMQAFVIGAIVGSALTAVLSFYFGSSRNSAAKDATISQLANK